MYRILNPLNHNVALVRNDKGEELIVIGKGIVFGKKKGDLVPKEKVEKLFRMKTRELYDPAKRRSFRLHHSDLRDD